MKLIGFKQSVEQFISSKSNWAGITAIAVGVYLFSTGEVKLAIESIFGGLALVFVKDAITKIER